MGQHLAAQRQQKREEKPTDLFGIDLPAKAGKLRTSEQLELLARIAEDLAELLDELDSRLRADRSRAVPIAAGYLAPLEAAAENLSSIRDIDEHFGGPCRRPPKMAGLAEQLEKGLAYLLGVLSVAIISENMSPFNWRMVERDVQEVQSIAGRLQENKCKSPMKAA